MFRDLEGKSTSRPLTASVDSVRADVDMARKCLQDLKSLRKLCLRRTSTDVKAAASGTLAGGSKAARSTGEDDALHARQLQVANARAGKAVSRSRELESKNLQLEEDLRTLQYQHRMTLEACRLTYGQIVDELVTAKLALEERDREIAKLQGSGDGSSSVPCSTALRSTSTSPAQQHTSASFASPNAARHNQDDNDLRQPDAAATPHSAPSHAKSTRSDASSVAYCRSLDHERAIPLDDVLEARPVEAPLARRTLARPACEPSRSPLTAQAEKSPVLLPDHAQQQSPSSAPRLPAAVTESASQQQPFSASVGSPSASQLPHVETAAEAGDAPARHRWLHRPATSPVPPAVPSAASHPVGGTPLDSSSAFFPAVPRDHSPAPAQPSAVPSGTSPEYDPQFYWEPLDELRDDTPSGGGSSGSEESLCSTDSACRLFDYGDGGSESSGWQTDDGRDHGFQDREFQEALRELAGRVDAEAGGTMPRRFAPHLCGPATAARPADEASAQPQSAMGGSQHDGGAILESGPVLDRPRRRQPQQQAWSAAADQQEFSGGSGGLHAADLQGYQEASVGEGGGKPAVHPARRPRQQQHQLETGDDDVGGGGLPRGSQFRRRRQPQGAGAFDDRTGANEIPLCDPLRHRVQRQAPPGDASLGVPSAPPFMTADATAAAAGPAAALEELRESEDLFSAIKNQLDSLQATFSAAKDWSLPPPRRTSRTHSATGSTSHTTREGSIDDADAAAPSTSRSAGGAP